MSQSIEMVARSWEELTGFLYHKDWAAGLQRHRSSFVYRGLPDSRYSLTTSLNRNGDAHLEKHLLRNFKKYSHASVAADSHWMWLEHFPPDLGRYPYPAWRK